MRLGTKLGFLILILLASLLTPKAEARPFCNPQITWNSETVLVPLTYYTIACTNVDIALIDVYQGSTYLFQITSVDHAGSCGDQDYAFPNVGAGTYTMQITVYPCDDCPAERKSNKTITVN